MTHQNTKIGSNIKPGMRPGGFTTNFTGQSKPLIGPRRKKGRPSIHDHTQEIKEAANAVLEGRSPVLPPETPA
jgi:hypothetical protein